LNVQTKEIDNFSAWESGHDSVDGGYDRAVPDRFSEERDDTLMKSLIQNYALEVKNADGKPSGQFFLNKDSAKSASNEVVKTHGSND
jgi:hypothetical protein